MLNVNNISFSYGDYRVLSEVSFTLSPGKIIGILGPNGAGKSTLLKLINAQLKPDAGHIKINNTDLSDFSIHELARQVSTIHQQFAPAFGYRVEELVAMGRYPFTGPFGRLGEADHEIVERALETTGLNNLKDRKISQLSGGEQQLVFTAKALAQQPNILLMDEATSNLDIRHTAHILQLIKDQAKEQQLGVLAVIHDINLASAFCDEILLISEHKAIGPDAPEKLITEATLTAIYNIPSEQVVVHNTPTYVETLLK